MRRRGFWKLALALAVLCGVAYAGRLHVTRPPCRSGIPGEDYQWRNRSRSEVAVSKTSVSLPTHTPGQEGRRDILLYQFVEKPKLEIDHCAISQMAVSLHKQGRVTVSLRADQNATMPPDQTATTVATPTVATPTADRLAKGEQKFTLQLKRNEFFIKVRAYAAYPDGALIGGDTLGKPVMFTIGPKSFWVQRGQPYDFHCEFECPAAAKYYDHIERVELEFYYR